MVLRDIFPFLIYLSTGSMAYQQVLQMRARKEKCTGLLQEHYETLAIELSIRDILDKLFSKKIISFKLKQSIKDLSTSYDASVMFLDDLYEHFNSERFDGFVNILKNDESVACSKHKALAKLLVTEGEMETNVSCTLACCVFGYNNHQSFNTVAQSFSPYISGFDPEIDLSLM